MSARVLVVSNDGRLLFSGGHWDCSLRVTQLGKGKLVGRICRHIGKKPLGVLSPAVFATAYFSSWVFGTDVVTCLALDLCGIYLISGSRDTSCIVWKVLQQVNIIWPLARSIWLTHFAINLLLYRPSGWIFQRPFSTTGAGSLWTRPGGHVCGYQHRVGHGCLGVKGETWLLSK